MKESSPYTRRKDKIRNRLHQISRYLQDEYKVKVRLRVEKMPKCSKDCLGEICFDTGKLPPLIRVCNGISKSEAISTLLHEFAHAVSHVRHGPCWDRDYHGHDKNFAIVLNEIENKYFYEEGAEASLEY